MSSRVVAIYQANFLCEGEKDNSTRVANAVLYVQADGVYVQVSREDSSGLPMVRTEQLGSFVDAWHVMQYLPRVERLRAITLGDLTAAIKGRLHDSGRLKCLSQDMGMQPDDLLVSVWGSTGFCQSTDVLKGVLGQLPEQARGRLGATCRDNPCDREIIGLLDSLERELQMREEQPVVFLAQNQEDKKGLDFFQHIFGFLRRFALS